jgi:hypothetical protein
MADWSEEEFTRGLWFAYRLGMIDFIRDYVVLSVPRFTANMIKAGWAREGRPVLEAKPSPAKPPELGLE